MTIVARYILRLGGIVPKKRPLRLGTKDVRK
jgi:hypothetical protein